MILSVSRRTDVPRFYMEWFLQRLREGYADVRNPMNPRRVSRVPLTKETVDAVVFWTKDPKGLLAHGEEIPFPYYVQFTLNDYGPEVEPNLPTIGERVKSFCRLTGKIGPHRVIWRYDPILFNEKYTPEEHLRRFEKLASALRGSTDQVVVSFLDLYPKIQKRIAPLKAMELPEEELRLLAGELARLAKANGMRITTCAETIDLRAQGVEPGCCIDKNRLERLLGRPLKLSKDKNQRPACGCVESVDIGAYNTCLHGCRYCYANGSDALVAHTAGQYDVFSTMLCGKVGEEDTVTVRK